MGRGREDGGTVPCRGEGSCCSRMSPGTGEAGGAPHPGTSLTCGEQGQQPGSRTEATRHQAPPTWTPLWGCKACLGAWYPNTPVHSHVLTHLNMCAITCVLHIGACGLHCAHVFVHHASVLIHGIHMYMLTYSCMCVHICVPVHELTDMQGTSGLPCSESWAALTGLRRRRRPCSPWPSQSHWTCSSQQQSSRKWRGGGGVSVRREGLVSVLRIGGSAGLVSSFLTLCLMLPKLSLRGTHSQRKCLRSIHPSSPQFGGPSWLLIHPLPHVLTEALSL